ncbi:hypothetical protein AVEN_257523-1 [Araneus ventricosus]|uniref:Uncharacterized protein n=1 Tax=Araneus ventricosus TaxID=182803 RepID=A0A4Y2RUB8_ARAVE|nr:hypothetical protein AVEN_257523-1 [Araneus ventricosus]
MTPCRSNNSTNPLPSPLHSCLAEAPMQSMIWAGVAGQEQGQEEKNVSLSMNFKLLMCPLRNLANAVCADLVPTVCIELMLGLIEYYTTKL